MRRSSGCYGSLGREKGEGSRSRQRRQAHRQTMQLLPSIACDGKPKQQSIHPRRVRITTLEVDVRAAAAGTLISTVWRRQEESRAGDYSGRYDEGCALAVNEVVQLTGARGWLRRCWEQEAQTEFDVGRKKHIPSSVEKETKANL
jgi:hypothetical protein